MIGREGKITMVNAQIEKSFGYNRDELLGQPIEMLVPERFRTHHSDYRNSFRSEEHTSELQSQSNLVCRLLLEKKNGTRSYVHHRTQTSGRVAGFALTHRWRRFPTSLR